jgi:lysophospholipase L1-like esterase
MQSRYTAKDVLKVLNDSLKRHPSLKENESFETFKKFLADRKAMDEFVDRRRGEAWDKIVALSRREKFQLVLQNYPVEYKSANQMLANISRKYGLLLVDNRAKFSPAISEGGRGAVLEDNDHLTPEGYRQMAGHVFEALAGSSLAPEPSGK